MLKRVLREPGSHFEAWRHFIRVLMRGLANAESEQNILLLLLVVAIFDCEHYLLVSGFVQSTVSYVM